MATEGGGVTSRRGESGDDEEQRVSCPICYEIYINPLSLRCGHVICERCVHVLLEQHDFDKFPCAACREMSALDDLRSDFAMRDNVARYCVEHNIELPASSSSSVIDKTGQDWIVVPTCMAKLSGNRDRVATLARQRDSASPYCNVIVHSERHGDIPGKAQKWLMTTSPDKTFATIRHIYGNPVPADAIACGKQHDSGVYYAAIAHGQHGQVPGKAQHQTCWYPWGGKEFVTHDFSWVVVKPVQQQ